MSLLDSDVPIRNVVTTDPETVRALDNDVRAKIVDALADRAMAIDEIRDELERRGERKAETTVRHHVNVLEDAELVEIARLEEAGGGTRKYYESNTRMFSYELPDDADETLAAASADARSELSDLVEGLLDDHGEEIESIVAELKPCEYCADQHYEEFLVRELLHRALTDLAEAGDLAEAFAPRPEE